MSQENYDSAGNENGRGAYVGDGKFENDPPEVVVPETQDGEGGEWVCSIGELVENFKNFFGL